MNIYYTPPFNKSASHSPLHGTLRTQDKLMNYVYVNYKKKVDTCNIVILTLSRGGIHRTQHWRRGWLVKKCEFGTLEDEMVRCQIVEKLF